MKPFSSLKMQIASVAVVAIAGGILATSFTPLGDIADATGDDEPRQILAPQLPMDPNQSLALADGNVTRAEYDDAVNQTLACVRAAGGIITGLRYEYYRDRPVWSFAISYERAYSADEATPYDACWIRYSREVQAKWVDQHEPSAAKRAENEASALACARQEGLSATSLEALNGLIGKDNGDKQGGVNRCLTIAHKGYDLAEHPPVRAE